MTIIFITINLKSIVIVLTQIKLIIFITKNTLLL